LPTPQPEINDDAPQPEINDDADSPTVSGAEEATFDPNRRLCPDEACIGVIGSNKRCSVCGRQG
jgi:hypothetical protein